MNHFRCRRGVTMFMTPPMASAPNPTGTAPRYISIRSAKFTGMLLRLNELPTPSCGTPSMNIFTCFPLKPSIVTAISDPTPPLSLIFIPGALFRASLNVLVVFTRSRVFIAVALNAEFLILFNGLATTITSASCVAGCSLTFIFDRW